MEINKNIFIIILFFPLELFSKQFEYEVSIFGVYCADITINYTDTIYNKQQAIKIEYKTTTRDKFEYFFFIDNKYTAIINKKNYNMLNYNKKTTQPKVINSIETYVRNDSLFYLNNNQFFNNQYYNIFSLLHSLQMYNINNSVKSLHFLEREGSIYNMEIETFNSHNKLKYLLSFDLNKSQSNDQIFKNTDIFSWGIFLPNAKREINIDPINKIITSCKFSIGLINVKAKLK